MLIRLCGCADWYALLLFAYGKNRFSHDVAHIIKEWISFFWCLSKYKLHWVMCKVNEPQRGLCKLCWRKNVVYTSVNIRKIKFIRNLYLNKHFLSYLHPCAIARKLTNTICLCNTVLYFHASLFFFFISFTTAEQQKRFDQFYSLLVTFAMKFIGLYFSTEVIR